jgi:hypothetical protein
MRRSGSSGGRADSSAVTGEDDDAAAAGPATTGRIRLCAVRGPLAEAEAEAEPPPPVRLLREWKGATVTDLRRQQIVARLPGARATAPSDAANAQHAIARAPAVVLAGPGHARSARWFALALVGLAAVASAFALATWLGA